MLKEEYTATITLNDGTTEKVDRETFQKLSRGTIEFPPDIETAAYYGIDDLTGLWGDVVPFRVYDNINKSPTLLSVQIDLIIAIYNGEFMEG